MVEQVITKQLPVGSSERRLRFLVGLLRERSLSQVGPVLDCTELAVQRAFVPGHSLADLPRSWAPDQVLTVGRKLMAALHQLHGHGLVHGNLKPSNVIVGPDGGVVLVDLARLASPSPTPYRAPEGAGHLAAALTEVSDLFSAGAILLELATGGRELAALPKDHVLQLVLPQMLEPNPALRLPDASLAERFLSQRSDSRNSGPVLNPQAPRRLMVGRDAQLGQLEALWKGPAPGAVIVHGPAGIGKTRFAEELIYRLRPERVWSAQARAEAPRSLPFVEPLGLELGDPGCGPEEFAAERMLSNLLRQVHAASGPRTLWIWDDLDPSDSLSHALFARLARARIPGLLVVATTAAEPEPHSAALSLSLDPLSWEHVSALIKSHLGPPAEELVELVLEAARGNPFWTIQTVRTLEREGHLHRHQRRWRPREGTLRRTCEEWLEVRLGALDGALRSALARWAAIGTVFRVEQAELVHPESDLWSLLLAGQRGRLLHESFDGLSYRFTHESLREACLQLWPSSEREAVQRHLAAYEREPRARLYYLQQSGPSQGVPQAALDAARVASAALDWQAAQSLYELAAQPGGPPAAEEELADILFFSAQYARAEEAYLALLESRTEPEERIRLCMRLGRVSLLLGKLEQSAHFWQEATRLVPGDSEKLLPAMVSLVESRYVTGMSMLQMHAAMLARMHPDHTASLWALATRTASCLHDGRTREARAAAREVLPLLRPCPDRWSRGVSAFRVGYTFVALGKLKKAQKLFEFALSSLEGTGDAQETMLARFWLDHTRHLRGRPDPNLGEFTAALDASLPYAAALSRLGLAFRGCHPTSELNRSWADHPPLVRSTCELAKVLANLFQGRLRTAARLVARLDGAGHPAREIEIYCWRATIFRMILESAPSGLRRVFWRRAQRAAREALKRSRICRVRRPHALRELGWLAAEVGQPEKARRYLERSLSLARRIGARLEVACTQTALGRLGALLDWPDSGPMLKAGLAGLTVYQAPELREEAAPASRSRLDRFQQLLEWGTRLTRQLNESLVLETTRQGLAQLVQAEGCSLLPPTHEVPLGNVLVCSIACQGEPVCQLEAQHRLPYGRFSEEEKLLATGLAALTEVALSNARSFEAKTRNYACLQASQQRFQALLDGAGAGVALVDAEDCILEHNAELLRLLEQETLVGRRIQDLIEPAYQAAERTRFESGLARYSVEVPFRSPGPAWARLSLLRLPPSGLTIRSVSPSNPLRLQELLHFQTQERVAWARRLKSQVEVPLERLLEQLGEQPLASTMASRLRQELRDTRRGLQSQRRVPELLKTLLDMARADRRLVLDWNVPADEVDDLTASCLDRCVLELISNACRHAEATWITVTVEVRGAYVRATVQDDGKGFNVEQLGSTRRHGLKGVRFRIELLGGQLQLKSEEGRGSRARFSLPI